MKLIEQGCKICYGANSEECPACDNGTIQMTPGELANVIEDNLEQVRNKGRQQDHMKLIAILLEAIPAIVYALRLADMQLEEQANDEEN